MAKSKDKTSHPKKGLDNEALIEGEGKYLDYQIFSSPLRGCVLMSFRGEIRGILNLQVINNKRFLASLEMTNTA